VCEEEINGDTNGFSSLFLSGLGASWEPYISHPSSTPAESFSPKEWKKRIRSRKLVVDPRSRDRCGRDGLSMWCKRTRPSFSLVISDIDPVRRSPSEAHSKRRMDEYLILTLPAPFPSSILHSPFPLLSDKANYHPIESHRNHAFPPPNDAAEEIKEEWSREWSFR
jgi:hypothetical protein